MKPNAKPKSNTPVPPANDIIIPKCPKCTGEDIVQLDIIEAEAEITGIDSQTGEVEWGGYTEVCWDSQKPKHKPPHWYCRDCGFEGSKTRFIPKS